MPRTEKKIHPRPGFAPRKNWLCFGPQVCVCECRRIPSPDSSTQSTCSRVFSIAYVDYAFSAVSSQKMPALLNECVSVTSVQPAGDSNFAVVSRCCKRPRAVGENFRVCTYLLDKYRCNACVKPTRCGGHVLKTVVNALSVCAQVCVQGLQFFYT